MLDSKTYYSFLIVDVFKTETSIGLYDMGHYANSGVANYFEDDE